LRTTAAVAVLLSLTANAWGSGRCAQPEEAMALNTAAIQQQLMVAALSCHQTRLYNRFVSSYRGELQRSDAVLLHYFAARHGGKAAYHSYKTKLANAASLESLHDRHFCVEAHAVFHAALAQRGATLREALALDASGPDACRDGATMTERSAAR
jgi:hypothetical protein